MWALAGGEEIEMGVRTGWYLLLTLARARLADARDAAIPESAQGWLPLDELIRRLDTSENKLNVDIFRARKALASAGVDGAAGLVDRAGLARGALERRLGPRGADPGVGSVRRPDLHVLPVLSRAALRASSS